MPGGWVGRHSDQAVPLGVDRGSGAGVDVELGQEVGDVVVDSAGG